MLEPSTRVLALIFPSKVEEIMSPLVPLRRLMGKLFVAGVMVAVLAAVIITVAPNVVDVPPGFSVTALPLMLPLKVVFAAETNVTAPVLLAAPSAPTLVV
jgi:hypothetical protein